MKRTLQGSGYDGDQVAREYAAKLIVGAPAHLQYRAKLYQNCLARFMEQSRQVPLNSDETVPGRPDYVKICRRSLVKLAKRIDPEANDLVIFEIRTGVAIMIACIGRYLPLITVANDRDWQHTVVQTPRWVHEMMLEATEWERTTVTDIPHHNTPFKIGAAHPVPAESILAAAKTLWEPETNGVYKNFFDALEAAKLLA